jgi:MFS family permease
MAGEIVSRTGDQLWIVALAWTAIRLSGPGLAGVTIACASLPRACLMLVGGALADRVSLRRLMIACDLARTLVLAGAFVLLLQFGPSPALLIGISLCFGIADAVYTPASSSFPVQMVEGDELVALAGIRQLIGRGAVLAGAPLGGVVVALGGFRAAVLLDAASFGVIVLVLLGLRPRFDRATSTASSLLGDLRDGLAYVRRSKPVRNLTVALSGLNVFVTPVTAIGIAEHANAAGWGASRLGILTGAIGAGAAIGTVAAIRARPADPVRAGLLILLIQAGALGVIGLAPFAGAIAATTTVGITAGLASPFLAGAFQRTVNARYLGRANSLIAVSDAALTPLTLIAFGWIATRFGVAATCGMFGAGFAALLLYSVIRATPGRTANPNLRSCRSRPAVPARSRGPRSA